MMLEPIFMPDPLDPTIIHELLPILEPDNELHFSIDGEIGLSAQETHDALAPANHDESACPICSLTNDLTR